MPENCICIKFPNLLIFFLLFKDFISRVSLPTTWIKHSREKYRITESERRTWQTHTDSCFDSQFEQWKSATTRKNFHEWQHPIMISLLFSFTLMHSVCSVFSLLIFIFFLKILKILKNKEWFTKHFFNIYWHFAFKEGKRNINSIEKAFIATNSNISKMPFKIKYILF